MAEQNWTMKTTPIVVLGLLIVAGLWDLWCVTFGGTSSTVSAFMVRLGIKSPFIAFVIGCLCGHFFFYMYPVATEKKNNNGR